MVIVKVQVAVASTQDAPPALVYGKNRTMQHFREVDEELVKKMGGSLKKFFYAKVNRREGGVELLDEAPWQDW